ncbi:MAG: phosphatase PAP2 family protein [Bdellovibrionales bacterium]
MILPLSRLTYSRRVSLAMLIFLIFEVLLMAFVDRPLSLHLRAVDADNRPLIDFFRAYTDFGKSGWYLWPSGIGLIICLALGHWRQVAAPRRKKFRHNAKKFGFFFAAVAASGIITDILKLLFGRARPVLLDREGFYGFDPFTFASVYKSFPSGHTTTAFAVAFALMALYPRGRVWWLIGAVSLGVSRVMVNAHYFSDLFAGALVAFLTVEGLRYLFVRRRWLFEKHGFFPIDRTARMR